MTENELTDAIIGAAIVVHRRLGPGLLESVYRRCLAYELRKRGLLRIKHPASADLPPRFSAPPHLRV